MIASRRKLPTQTFLAAMVAAGLTVSTTTAFAWGADGHRLVAEEAELHLSAAARVEVDRLLKLEPGATLRSISVASPGDFLLQY